MNKMTNLNLNMSEMIRIISERNAAVEIDRRARAKQQMIDRWTAVSEVDTFSIIRYEPDKRKLVPMNPNGFKHIEFPQIKNIDPTPIQDHWKSEIDLARFPHRCPRCQNPAYIGFSTVECSAEGCR